MPASASVWQPPQPAEPVKTCLPIAACAAGPLVPGGALGGAVWERSQVRNFCGVTTWTVPRMVECPMPHSSAHTIG